MSATGQAVESSALDEQHPALPRRLDSIFLTGPGGLIFEIPRAVAEQYVLTMERMKELRHLPITPYGVDSHHQATDDDGEVGGRHMVMLASGTLGYHSDVRFGAFLWTDGQYYVGDHYHPYGTDLAFTP
jgi:hypothetical protein